MNDIETYKHTIAQKLHTFNKKFTVTYRNTMNVKKRNELRDYITKLEDLFRKLENNSLTWEDLQQIGISKKSIFDLYELENNYPHDVAISDFEMISTIPQIVFVEESLYFADKINVLYSIIEFININYQIIFTQRILISASKTNSLREVFYMQYQDILHVFHSYKSYVLIPSTKDSHTHMLNKEYTQLIKAIIVFLTSIQSYIKLIFTDNTFTMEDFNHIIITNSESYVDRLSLREALTQCQTFVNEAISFIQSTNKDIFDSLSIQSKLKNPNSSMNEN